MANKIKLHPLFLIVGLYAILSGKGEYFVICVGTSVIHEFGHIAMAKYCNVLTNSICIMPYGAVVNANLGKINKLDDIKIALAGPLLNLVFAILVTALWWLFPIVFHYTNLLVMVNVAIGIINLLPCYPLDGGRILISILSYKFSYKVASLISRVLGIIFGVVLICIFVISCFSDLNLTFLFMGIFIIIGAWKGIKSLRVTHRLENIFSIKNQSSFYPVKEVMVSSDVELYKLAGLIGHSNFLRVSVVDEKFNVIATFDEGDVIKLIANNDSFAIIRDVVKKN